jgi:hypothetical protein
MMEKEPATRRKTHPPAVERQQETGDEFASRSKKGRPGWNCCRVMGEY